MFLVQEGGVGTAHYVLTVVVVLLVFAAEEAVARWRWCAAWNTRGYVLCENFFHVRNTAVRLGVVVAAGVGFPLLFGWDVFASAVFALAGYAAYSAVFFDVTQTKIPKEPCWAVLSAGSVFVAADYVAVKIFEGVYNNAGLVSYAVAFVSTTIITLFLAFITRGGFGSGDVRYIVMLSPIGFWAGYSALLLALLLASVFQLFVFVFFRLKAGGFGGSGSRMLPFAPSLTAGYAVAVFFFAGPAQVCLEWANTVSCR